MKLLQGSLNHKTCNVTAFTEENGLHLINPVDCLGAFVERSGLGILDFSKFLYAVSCDINDTMKPKDKHVSKTVFNIVHCYRYVPQDFFFILARRAKVHSFSYGSNKTGDDRVSFKLTVDDEIQNLFKLKCLQKIWHRGNNGQWLLHKNSDDVSTLSFLELCLTGITEERKYRLVTGEVAPGNKRRRYW